MASLTTLMFALVFLYHNPGCGKVFSLSAADEILGSQPHIYRGESVSMKDLFYTSLFGSDNLQQI